MNLRYRMELDQAEPQMLTAMVERLQTVGPEIKRARILLTAHAGLGDEVRGPGGWGPAARPSSAPSGASWRRAWRRRSAKRLAQNLSGKEEALLVATACASPPSGCARWSLELLAGEFVKLTEHETLSRETVRRRLAENHLKPWRKDM